MTDLALSCEQIYATTHHSSLTKTSITLILVRQIMPIRSRSQHPSLPAGDHARRRLVYTVPHRGSDGRNPSLDTGSSLEKDELVHDLITSAALSQRLCSQTVTNSICSDSLLAIRCRSRSTASRLQGLISWVHVLGIGVAGCLWSSRCTPAPTTPPAKTHVDC